jgi:hypothetical protein
MVDDLLSRISNATTPLLHKIEGAVDGELVSLVKSLPTVVSGAEADLGWLKARTELRRLFDPASPGCKADIGWARALDPTVLQRDMTEQFTRIYDSIRDGTAKLPDFDQCAHLFVPGLLTKHYVMYFTQNMKQLRDLGANNVYRCDDKKSPLPQGFDTDQSVAWNWPKVRDQIKALSDRAGKQVMVHGHSKGGVDAAAAFANSPELEPLVADFIAMQTPFGGTPIATDMEENAKLELLVDRFMRDIFHGSAAAIGDLSYPATRERLKDGIDFAKLFNTYSFATYSETGLTALSALYMDERYRIKNDGLVPCDDAMIPFSRGVIIVPGMNHAGPAMGDGLLSQYKPGLITQALVMLALGNH